MWYFPRPLAVDCGQFSHLAMVENTVVDALLE
jgi:hypothetical protein